ncbi:MAG: replication initiation protein [Gammaproteobacteria bacterium]|nr:replication initiation protein [Gammaproteobacteria bacterium]
MGKTIEVAADRAYDQTKTVLPAEMAQGVYMENVPSLQALKLMHLMIGVAGGRMADDLRHEFHLSDVKKIEGMNNHSRGSLAPLFKELRAVIITEGAPEHELDRVIIGGLLDQAILDRQDPVSGEIMLSWYFGRSFRDLARDSNHWAILDRQAVFHLGSKYSVVLFQHIASLQNLKHVTSKRFTVPALRALFGIAEGKLPRFSNLKQKALVPAIADINSDLTRLHLTVTYHKTGRSVAEIEIAWEVKEDLAKVKAELNRPKVGRKSRHGGACEAPVTSFPCSGRVDGKWEVIARDKAPRLQGNHIPDLLTLSSAFRKWCEERSIRLDAKSIEKTFTTWCKSYSPR